MRTRTEDDLKSGRVSDAVHGEGEPPRPANQVETAREVQGVDRAGTGRLSPTRLGFKTRIPENWNKLWVAMWILTAPSVVVSAFFVRIWLWIPAAVVGFLLPEMISIHKEDDSLPPLTHMIRHFLPDWMAFPLIYFSLGSVGAHWLNFHRPAAIGVLMGLLGWLTDHFTVTYAKPDPFPFANRPLRAGTDRRRMPS